MRLSTYGKMSVLLVYAAIFQQSFSFQLPIIGKLSDIVPEDDHRIIKGKACFVENHPYMVSLRLVHEMKHFCGGTILSPKSVLTAAHCVFDYSHQPKKFVVAAGLTENSTTIQIRHVERISIPRSYSYERMVGDLSVMHLEHPFEFGDVVQPVVLHPWQRFDVVKFCPKGLIIGWGSTIPKPSSRSSIEAKQMLCAEVPVISFSECQKYLNLLMDSSKFCAMGHGEDACLGDSGGPMMCGGMQIGVISSGNGCGAKGQPGIYARVDYHYNYITRMMNGQIKSFNTNVKVVLFASVTINQLFGFLILIL